MNNKVYQKLINCTVKTASDSVHGGTKIRQLYFDGVFVDDNITMCTVSPTTSDNLVVLRIKVEADNTVSFRLGDCVNKVAVGMQVPCIFTYRK